MNIDFRPYLNQTVNWLVTSGPRIVVILVLMFVGVRLSRVAAARLFALLGRRKMDEEYRKRADTLSAVVAYAIGAIVIVVAALMILAELNIHIAPILATAGVVGIAVGFGAQNLVQDIISGFFILLEDEIRVGDVVEIAGKTGLVERLNLRMVVLRDDVTQPGNDRDCRWQTTALCAGAASQPGRHPSCRAGSRRGPEWSGQAGPTENDRAQRPVGRDSPAHPVR